MVFGINAAGSAMQSLIQTSAKSPKATKNLLQDLGKNVIDARVANHKTISHGWVGGGLALAAGGFALLHAPFAAGALAFIGAKTAGLSILGGSLLGKTALGGAAATAAAANTAAATAAAGPTTAALTTAATTANTALGGMLTSIGAWGAGIGSGISNVVGLGFKSQSDALLRPVEDLAKHTAQEVAQKVTQEVVEEGGEAVANQAPKGRGKELALAAGAGATGGVFFNPFSGSKPES